jgi:succinate dehydrogenase/fumarate reductase flavoprotein subunit
MAPAGAFFEIRAIGHAEPDGRKIVMERNRLAAMDCDVLVIGGGGAGLTAAIRAREAGADAVIVSKSRVGYGNNTFISKGVFAAATGRPDPADNAEAHVLDTLSGGRSINDDGLVRAVAARAAEQIAFLERCGGKFSRKDGRLEVSRAPGHRYPRHVRGENYSGKDFILPLRDHARRIGVRFIDQVFVTRLFSSNGIFAGAVGVAAEGGIRVFSSPCAVLTTGGYAQIYRQTNNAAGMTGDGHVLACELGVPLRDMEFVQFYPTALSKGTRVLLYENFLARAGAVLRNSLGEDILARNGMADPMAVTRDQLAKTIMIEVTEGRGVDGGVVMDLSSIPEAELNRFPNLLPADRSPGQCLYHVSPTAHFCMGGIVIDASARTAVEGLYAAGECCGGAHGANRLAGNALIEVFAMGGTAGVEAARESRRRAAERIAEPRVREEVARLEGLCTQGDDDLRAIRRGLREAMWQEAGILRSGPGLTQTLHRVRELSARLSHAGVRGSKDLVRRLELDNMLAVSEIVCSAALMREESRGSHFRRDFPDEDDERWLKTILIRKRGSKTALEAMEVGGR